MVKGNELFYKEEKITNEEKQQNLFYADLEIKCLVTDILEGLGLEKKESCSHTKPVKKNKGETESESKSESKAEAEAEAEAEAHSDMEIETETETETEKEQIDIKN